ncbi:MAG: alpha/beta hydrolase, partial [Proteobacteria bacterium]|nr:alpha/beta hydrolase [Pseudomonadota bacterium]
MSHIGLYWVHGRDAKPWGTKSQGLRDVAAEFGLEMLAPDFRGVMDPDQRVRMLVETIGDRPGPLVLVGSSMGGYVSTATCHELDVSRVFALAPAFGLPGYRWQEFPWLQTPVEIVAGWRDAV